MSLISHNNNNDLLKEKIDKIKKRIKLKNENAEVQIKILEQLSEFELGRFLILNKGLNGFWTSYLINHIYGTKKISQLERIFLEELPTVQATQNRAKIFQKQIQNRIKNNSIFASIPCGTAEDLLTLNFKSYKNIQLIGIDLDRNSLNLAQRIAEKNNLKNSFTTQNLNAWKLNFENKFDLITSNGLNIYEKNEKKIVKLYENFYNALKNKGALITSFLTFPPTLDKNSPWKMETLNKEKLDLQKIIFSDILKVNWQSFNHKKDFKKMLENIGFSNIKIYSDKACQFPTVVAEK